MGEGTSIQSHKKLTSKLSNENILDWLLEPAKTVQEQQRRQVRSFSSLLLLLTVMTLVGSLFARAPTAILLGTDIFIVTSYILSRTKYHRAGGLLAIGRFQSREYHCFIHLVGDSVAAF